MDTVSTLIGLGLLALFMLPILYLIWQQNNKEKNRLRNLRNISTQNNLTSDTFEISNNLLLGLDSKANKLLIIEPTNKMQHRVLDLTKIKNSKVSSHPFPENRKLIKSISLDLSENERDQNPLKIIFYDEDDNENNNASERLVVAKKWQGIINAKLSA
ncbi:hypothetical protein SAMN05660776_1643 [Salegentibacter holothuriorum]|uniref:Uncharacterized protein n=1 Tax=Salegentibacter holothuriorum TaxID=241145 RepID=A0A1T5C0D3_9FLAO|nr:hypothetical protein [Salegentibacter holothuriorum]SKB52600.1 hypothetical protein SAMN05660776_1643 [Salegentibacter holothuriorum]